MGDRALAVVYAQRAPTEFSREIVLRDSFALQEGSDVFTVTPIVSIDRDGGFLVADGSEGQVRLYTSRGALKHRFGANGSGPMEFRSLAKAVRLPGGEIAAADMGGKLSIFDPEGTRLLTTSATGIVPLYDVAVLDAERLVIAGRRHGAMNSDLLHVFDRRANRVVHSFMPVPPHDRNLDGAYAFTGFSAVAIRGGIIAGMFALSDSIHLYSPEGAELATIPIPYQHFRRLTEPLPQQQPRVALQRWMEGFSTASNLFWLPNGDFVVQYGDAEKNEMRWRLLRMDRDGRLLFDLVDTPLLFAISPNDAALYFARPDAETLNLWSIAYFRRHSPR